jgi:hypothetical protein
VKTPEQQQAIKAAWKLANKPKQIGVEILCSGCASQIDLERPLLKLGKGSYCGPACPWIVERNRAKGKS